MIPFEGGFTRKKGTTVSVLTGVLCSGLGGCGQPLPGTGLLFGSFRRCGRPRGLVGPSCMRPPHRSGGLGSWIRRSLKPQLWDGSPFGANVLFSAGGSGREAGQDAVSHGRTGGRNAWGRDRCHQQQETLTWAGLVALGEPWGEVRDTASGSGQRVAHSRQRKLRWMGE